MEDYGEGFYEEERYLENAVAAIRQQLEAAEEGIKKKRKSLRALRQDMWDNTDHSPREFSGVADISLYRSEVHVSTQTYANSLKNIEKYNKMLETPYFGRFDFLEEGYDTKEKIYVGRGTLMDPETCKVLVYDWRAPVSSVYYRHELGPAQYETPSGMVSGEVLLKRQYQMQDGKLRHFFDCSVVITDEILIDILSRNASSKMKSIIESIQKEQDVIIRDTVNDLVMVQGAAGSGKTSIALHRIAYLLYEGLGGGTLTPGNIIIVSPNEVFSQYISNVLPDLGEQNVEQITFDRIAQDHLGDDFLLENRALQMERVMGADERLPFQNIDFKGSNAFKDILDRLMWYYEHEILPFEDVYYNGVVVATRQDLKSRFLNKRNLPMARRGQRIEAEIWEAIHPLRKKRLQTLEGIVQKSQGQDLEIWAFCGLLSIM